MYSNLYRSDGGGYPGAFNGYILITIGDNQPSAEIIITSFDFYNINGYGYAANIFNPVITEITE